MRHPHKRFADRSAASCSDPQLRANLKAAALHFKGKRDRAFADFAEGERYRDLARRIKEDALARVADLLKELEENVVAAGGRVHWAADAAEAGRIVETLARAYGVGLAVKGKSMVTEEVQLNKALEAAGVEVLETDLGEYIVQLAGEGPSHIIAPAVHKNREEIADLFSRHLGLQEDSDPARLTRVARAVLRKRFLEADMGITGANMALAGTGSVVLVENEGNIRLSTTAPRVHVAVMGLEKVVPGPLEMGVLLSLLPRSASGQKLSSYVSLLTGPRREGERDGARAFHLVLLDNGRSRILADPKLREILYCLRCGACLNVCPVYEKAGGHSYGGVYSGPMGSVLTPLLGEQGAGRDLAFACTQCGACAEVCPVRIDLPGLLLELRHQAAEGGTAKEGLPLSRGAARTYAAVCSHPGLYRTVTSLARTMDPGSTISRRLPGLGGRLRAWARYRSMPRWQRPFSRGWKKRLRSGGLGDGQVGDGDGS